MPLIIALPGYLLAASALLALVPGLFMLFKITHNFTYTGREGRVEALPVSLLVLQAGLLVHLQWLECFFRFLCVWSLLFRLLNGGDQSDFLGICLSMGIESALPLHGAEELV